MRWIGFTCCGGAIRNSVIFRESPHTYCWRKRSIAAFANFQAL